MNWKYCARLLIPTLGIAMSSVVAQGCANSEGAPFHMYDSPLLEGRVESRYPRSRSFDPLEAGDHPEPTTRVAESNARGGSQQSPPTREDTAPKKTPSLSTARKAAPEKTHTGAPATNEASSRASSKTAKAPAKRSSGEAALAAEYVWSVYGLNDVRFSESARGSVSTLFRECKERGKIYHSSRPAIGDVVFFHNTDDANADGRNNDWYTHVAIVESRDGSQTTLLGYRDGEVQRFVMDLESPDATRTRHGEVANAQLRQKRGEDPPFTQYLAGQLFAGSCSALGERQDLVVIDNWKPGMKLEP